MERISYLSINFEEPASFESLKDHDDETPGTLLEYHGNRQDSSSVEPTETTVETPAVVQDSKGV